MKHCNKCNTTKPLDDFYLDRSSPDGKTSHCKACKIEYARRYRENNLEACRKREREYSAKHSDDRKRKVEEFYKKNPEKKREYQIRHLSKPEVKEARKKWARDYSKRKRRECEIYRLRLICRSRLHIALARMGERKTSKTFKTIGCSPNFLARYLESQFEPGMTWENHGEWHIDHIVPLCNAKTKEDVLKLSHYTNLQPKWAKDNWSKGGRPQLEMQASYDPL